MTGGSPMTQETSMYQNCLLNGIWLGYHGETLPSGRFTNRYGTWSFFRVFTGMVAFHKYVKLPGCMVNHMVKPSIFVIKPAFSSFLMVKPSIFLVKQTMENIWCCQSHQFAVHNAANRSCLAVDSDRIDQAKKMKSDHLQATKVMKHG